MANAELLIVVGSRAVCQADCSGIGYKSAKHVININGDLDDVSHYNDTLALPGDITQVAERLTASVLAAANKNKPDQRLKASDTKASWLASCSEKKVEWTRYKQARFAAAPIQDEVWRRPALTQPAAIKIVADFAKEIGAAKFFDAGDVQANGFQIVEDDRSGDTFTESGASYMGFAASALLASALAEHPHYGIAFCGDGSFMMNPQILIDGIEHGVRGMIVIFDNRRMAAITGLQIAQYGEGFRTGDRVAVDYVNLANAVTGVKAVHGGWSTAELRAALGAARPTDFRWCVPVIVVRMSSAALARGANGMSAIGATMFSANGLSRIFDAIFYFCSRLHSAHAAMSTLGAMKSRATMRQTRSTRRTTRLKFLR